MAQLRAPAATTTVTTTTSAPTTEPITASPNTPPRQIVNEYAFDEAFSAESTQNEVYSATAAKYVHKVRRGGKGHPPINPPYTADS